MIIFLITANKMGRTYKGMRQAAGVMRWLQEELHWSRAGRTQVWRAATGRRAASWDVRGGGGPAASGSAAARPAGAGSAGGVLGLGFAMDGGGRPRVLVGCDDGTVRLMNYSDGSVLRRLSAGPGAEPAALLGAEERGQRRVYAAVGSWLCAWEDPPPPTGAASAAMAGGERTAATAALRAAGHEGGVADLCAAPPDAVATCGADGRVVVWRDGAPRRVMVDPAASERPPLLRGMHRICWLGPTSRSGGAGAGAAGFDSADDEFGSDCDDGEEFVGISAAARGGRPAGGRLVTGGADGRAHVWELGGKGGHWFDVEVFPASPAGFGVTFLSVDRCSPFPSSSRPVPFRNPCGSALSVDFMPHALNLSCLPSSSLSSMRPLPLVPILP